MRRALKHNLHTRKYIKPVIKISLYRNSPVPGKGWEELMSDVEKYAQNYEN
jgi:hypothetical protein